MTTISAIPNFVRGRQRVPGYIDGMLSPSAVDQIRSDTFTDTDTTDLTAHTMDSGSGWTAWAGTITIVGNAAVCQSATDIYVTDCGQPNLTITCDIKAGRADANCAPSIIFRGINAQNYLEAYFSGDGTFTIYQKVNNVLSAWNAGGSWPADTNFHTVKMVCDGTHISIYVGTTLIFDRRISTFSSGTMFGIGGFVFSGSKDSFDNFSASADRRITSFPYPFPNTTFTDTFTAADNTRLSTLGWTEDVGTWLVTSNKARQTLTTSPANGYVVSRDCGQTDVGLECKFTTPSSGGMIAGLVFRMVDKNHYIECEYNTNTTQGGFGIWYTANDGAYVEVARQNHYVFAPANSTTYTMRARVVGPIIYAELVEPGLSLKGYCSEFPLGTKVGLFEARSASYGENLYDDFKIYL